MKSIRMNLAALVLAALPMAASGQSMPGSLPALQSGFGGSVVIVGDEVLIGEPRNVTRPGIVYAYTKSMGSWTEAQQITGPRAAMGDGFGTAMATDGMQVMVSSEGAVHVYEKNGTWSHVDHLASDADSFGSAIAMSGDWALVASSGVENRGQVHVYMKGTDGKWAASGTITRPDAADNDRFGASVALDGGNALISATGRNNRAGAIYHYRYDESAGEFVEVGEVAVQGIAAREGLGSSIAIHGDVALVGAPMHAGQVGGAFMLSMNDSGNWVMSQRLLPFDGRRRGQFGSAVAITDEAIYVGAAGMASVYQFERSEDGFGGVEKLTSENAGGLGAAMAVTDEIAAFGMPNADFGQGQAGIFEATPDGWNEAGRLMTPEDTYAAVSGSEVECDGEAAHFACADVDLVSFMPVDALGGDRGISTNDVWGWTDSESGKEYALVGMTNQTAFVDLSNPTNPTLVGTLPIPETARGSIWRDIKVYDNHAYVVADGAGQHGMQVFDLTRLRDFDGEAMEFDHDALYDAIGSAHNIVINEDTGFGYAVGVNSGGETCGGGLHMIDIRNPTTPTFAGCFADPLTGRRGTGYTHDAQCVTYNGPDEDYQGREICFNANETALSIGDVTDKDNVVALSRGNYPNPGYTHQGWLDDEQRYFYINDELDEIQGTTDRTRTMIFDVTDLDDPQFKGFFFGTEGSSDHNLYVLGDRMYQSNYQGGLRVVDISDRETPEEIAFFDTVPHGTNTAGFGGSWSNYPFFQSGIVIVTSGREGLFLVRPRERRPIS